MRRMFLVLAFTTVGVTAYAGDLTNQFVHAKLAYGASIDIPRSWRVLHGSEMRAIETSVGAAIDLTGLARIAEGTESLLVANSEDPRLYASVTVTAITIKNSTPRSLLAFTDADVRAGESTIRQGIETLLARLGSKVSGWTRLEKVQLADTAALHVSYIRSSDAGNRLVHLYKIFGTGRVYDVVVATSLAHEQANMIVLNRIATSFKAP